MFSYDLLGVCGTSWDYVGHFGTMWDTMGDIIESGKRLLKVRWDVNYDMGLGLYGTPPGDYVELLRTMWDFMGPCGTSWDCMGIFKESNAIAL